MIFSKGVHRVGSLHTSQVVHQVGVYPGLCSMKRRGIFLLPPWMGCRNRKEYAHYILKYPSIHLGVKRHYVNKVAFSRT